jgi:hypothetical protein
MEMTAVWKERKSRSPFPLFPHCLGKLAKTASFPHSHSFGDDLGFPSSPSSFNFNFNEKCSLHARYLLLPTCQFAQQSMRVVTHGKAFPLNTASAGAEALIFVDPFSARLNSLRKKSERDENESPQRLKPDLFATTYVRAEARTLQKSEFFRKL